MNSRQESAVSPADAQSGVVAPQHDQPSRTHRDDGGRGRGGPRRGGAGTMAGITPGAPSGDPAGAFRIAALHRGVFGFQPARGSSPSGGPGAPQPGPGSGRAVSSVPPGRAAVLAALPGPAPRGFRPAPPASGMSGDPAARAPRDLPRAAPDPPVPAPPHTGRGPMKPHGAVRSARPVPKGRRAAPAGFAGGPKQHHSGGTVSGVSYHGRHGVAHLPLALAAPARPRAYRLPPVPAG